MKINVTVDLSDFYNEEDEASFSEQIKGAIAYDVKNQVLADFRKTIGDEFNKAVYAKISEQKDGFITAIVSELVNTAKVKRKYGSTTDEKISIADYVRDELERTSINDSNLNEFLSKQTKLAAETIGKELKARYDMLFASQIVSKLHESGMLKDDIAKILLNA